MWRFGRTTIAAAGPFSYYTGLYRMQVLVDGIGLVLETPDGEIDVRRPFKPVRFAGETRIMSRLEAGPVEVINLMGDRGRARIDLAVLTAGETRNLGPGVHIAYCPAAPARLRLQGAEHDFPADGGLRIEGADGWPATCTAGVILMGSVTCVSR